MKVTKISIYFASARINFWTNKKFMDLEYKSLPNKSRKFRTTETDCSRRLE